ncbi:LysR family transcriptional regulator [Paenibacillus aceris]|uniref:DNA-binding transcriptional LysR family regulator n=1 Tax=Paenibacillus aceris TaxID=869555 RepID=A0ABS4HV48_9BACL|nr:LysR family transcriptional regulator [Paenibacillus aceris]MBP1962504.1 DNA-binding transcriptional LysR family regulator [Paenibacillus aceris]NHW37317.1 LysR family transcriptional regulator [Paenibacillus aceris]
MELLDVFAVVVEQVSLNKASQLLNISQPALSRKIMKLEEELGVELFMRKGKRLELTKAGQICYDHALELRHLERKFKQTLQMYKAAGTHTSITIGASLTTLQATLPDLITDYLQVYPLTEIKLLTGKTHEIVTMVKENKVDIGIVASQINASSLHCEPLFDDHLCLVLPLGHPFIDRAEITMNDLNDLPMILFSKGTWYRILMDELFHRYTILPNVQMEIDSFEAIIRLVSTCKTATLLPKSYLREDLIQNNELILRYLDELEQTKRTTSLIYSDQATDSPESVKFIEQAINYFAKHK